MWTLKSFVFCMDDLRTRRFEEAFCDRSGFFFFLYKNVETGDKEHARKLQALGNMRTCYKLGLGNTKTNPNP